jgi:hypothetical protein
VGREKNLDTRADGVNDKFCKRSADLKVGGSILKVGGSISIRS